ncbi:MAG: SRPBCC family protein [Rhodospirillales bacterium]
MAKVSMSTSLPVPAAEVWKLIGGFNALPDWHPAVECSELADGGRIRTLTLLGGAKIVEKLEYANDGMRTYSYSIVDSPLPVANYWATIELIERRDGTCSVSWSSDFEPRDASESEAVAAVQRIYQQGFDNLREIFGG